MAEMNVDAGALDKLIEIVEFTPTYDGANYETGHAERLVRRCWAQFSRQSGTESLRAGADLSLVKARFLVRAGADITRLMNIRYNGELYNILYVNQYADRGGYTEIITELKALGGKKYDA